MPTWFAEMVAPVNVVLSGLLQTKLAIVLEVVAEPTKLVEPPGQNTAGLALAVIFTLISGLERKIKQATPLNPTLF